MSNPMEIPQIPKASKDKSEDLLSRIKATKQIIEGMRNLGEGIAFGARMNRLLDKMRITSGKDVLSDFTTLEQEIKYPKSNTESINRVLEELEEKYNLDSEAK